MGRAPPATLRHRRLWLGLGAGFVALVVWLSLAPSAPDAGRLGELKVGHFLAYGWLMLWFSQLYPRRGHRYALAAVLVAMGVGLEYLQALTPHRTFAYADMRADAIGVAAGWMLGAMLDGRLLPLLERAFPGASAPKGPGRPGA